MTVSLRGNSFDLNSLRVAVVTVSDSRTKATDTSGKAIVAYLERAGHRVVDKRIVTDDLDELERAFGAYVKNEGIDVVVSTGGTGITTRDITPEALKPWITKEILGFGELFRWISYQEIGTSTVQSRAMGALCEDTLFFLLPGSTGAVKTAMEEILIQQLDCNHKPCNFAELLPRVKASPEIP